MVMELVADFTVGAHGVYQIFGCQGFIDIGYGGQVGCVTGLIRDSP